MIHLGNREEIKHRTFWMMNQEKANDRQSFRRSAPNSSVSWFMMGYGYESIPGGVVGGWRGGVGLLFSAWVCSCRHIIHVNK